VSGSTNKHSEATAKREDKTQSINNNNNNNNNKNYDLCEVILTGVQRQGPPY
jgi:hypothetical protein